MLGVLNSCGATIHLRALKDGWFVISASWVDGTDRDLRRHRHALKVAMSDGDLPQNVDFAVKASIIAAFLDSNRVAMQTGAAPAKPLDPPDIADEARAISGFVACRP